MTPRLDSTCLFHIASASPDHSATYKIHATRRREPQQKRPDSISITNQYNIWISFHGYVWGLRQLQYFRITFVFVYSDKVLQHMSIIECVSAPVSFLCTAGHPSTGYVRLDVGLSIFSHPPLKAPHRLPVPPIHMEWGRLEPCIIYICLRY